MYHGVVTIATHAASELERAVALFHALSDATWLSILEMLGGGQRCVCEIQNVC